MKTRISWCDKLAPTIKHCGSWVCDKGWVNSKTGKRVHCSVCKKLNTIASLQTHPYSHNLEINQF